MNFAAKPIALIAMSASLLLSGSPDDSPVLPSIPFDQSGDYEFHFRQAHSREMTLLLAVDEGFKGESNRQMLVRLKTTIEVILVNHAGRTVCKATGTPKDGVTTDNWVLRVGAGEAAFWHRNCGEIKLKRSQSYTLTIHVRNVDPMTPKVRLTPTFERSDAFGP